MKKEANAAIEQLPEWILQNENDGKKNPRETKNSQESSPLKTEHPIKSEVNFDQKFPEPQIPISDKTPSPKKRSKNLYRTPTKERTQSPQKKRQKSKNSESNLLPTTSITTDLSPIPPLIASPPPLITAAMVFSESENMGSCELGMEGYSGSGISWLSKRRTVTIAKPEPPQPLDEPKMF